MFANRFTALIDASSLASVLRRNLLLSLAEAEFFRVRWSAPILLETGRAIGRMLAARGHADASDRAGRAVASMVAAFEDASVTGFEGLLDTLGRLPDADDAHVLAAAVKTRASVIVTENLKHFPASVLAPLDLEAKNADAFIADTIDLEPGRAVVAVRRMRERLRRPEKTAEQLLIDLEAAGLQETVDALREHVRSL